MKTRPTKRRRRWVAWGLVVALLCVCLLNGSCDTWFYWPDCEIYGTPASLGIEVEDVVFAAPGGPRLHGWWLPAQGQAEDPATDPAQGTVVYCHGNHGNLTHHAKFIAWLPARGFNVLIFDYRGFGRSGGTVSRAGTVQDAVAAIDVALARDPKRTVVFGHSLGGAIGLVAAAARPAVRGIIAESTFPSYRAAARCTAPLLGFLVPLLVSDGFDPVDALPRIPPRPLWVIHGTADAITPIELGRELYARALSPKSLRVIEGGGHRTAWMAEGAAFEAAVTAFFRAAIRRR